jgi:urea transport system permease protein
VVLVPGLLALVFGWLAFRSRVTGVYLSILTQAMTLALSLYLFQNDTGLRGNNGLSGLQNIPGADRSFRNRCLGLVLLGLGAGAGAGLCLAPGWCRASSAMSSAASATTRRVRFLGYPGGGLQAGGLHADGVICGIAGALYYPQAGIINPAKSRRSPRSTWPSGSPSAGAGGFMAR